VRRKSIDTLFISDFSNNRIVEVTAGGIFLRAIDCIHPYGIAYSGATDVLAVSLVNAGVVVLVKYDSVASIAFKPEVQIAARNAHGEVRDPRGVSFTADGSCLLVADFSNHRVSKFSAADGAFIAHVATMEANGIWCPTDVLQLDNGRIVVTSAGGYYPTPVCIGEEGSTFYINGPTDDVSFRHLSLSYSQSLYAVIVKTFAGKWFLLRDEWMHSSRCGWLSALTIGEKPGEE
jgi:DNA-binding beta-propeller fold protein YncE